MRRPEPVQLGCACGAALKFSSVDRSECTQWEWLFAQMHRGPGHEPVSIFEAREIRDGQRRRLAREAALT